MSHSPLDAEDGSAEDDYAVSWRALNKLLRRGYSWSGRERNCAFLGLDGGGFADVSVVSGLDGPDDGRAAVRIDWDRDGDLDLLMTARNGPRVRYFRNNLEGGRSVSVTLRGAGRNTAAIGARLELVLDDGRVLARGRRAGEGYLAQSSAWTVFGLEGSEPRELRVRWPNGERTSHSGLVAGERYTIAQGEEARVLASPETVALESAPPLDVPAPVSAARVVLPTPVPMPALPLISPSGREARLFNLGPNGERRTTGRPLLILLWASWCEPCVRELGDLTAHAAELAELGVDVLALSADVPADRESAQLILNRLAWPFSRGFAAQRAVDILDVLQGAILGRETRIPIPTSFLVDGTGNLVRLGLGPVTFAELREDIELLELDDYARRTRAIPFAGRWRNPPAPFDSSALAAAYSTRGFPEVARAYLFDAVEIRSTSRAEILYGFARSKAQSGNLEEAIRILREALNEDYKHFGARTDLGTALYRTGDLDGAVEAYEAALEIRSDDVSTLFNLGLAEFSRGNEDIARRVLERLRPLDADRAATLEQAFDLPVEDDEG